MGKGRPGLEPGEEAVPRRLLPHPRRAREAVPPRFPIRHRRAENQRRRDPPPLTWQTSWTSASGACGPPAKPGPPGLWRRLPGRLGEFAAL